MLKHMSDDQMTLPKGMFQEENSLESSKQRHNIQGSGESDPSQPCGWSCRERVPRQSGPHPLQEHGAYTVSHGDMEKGGELAPPGCARIPPGSVPDMMVPFAPRKGTYHVSATTSS